MTSFGRKWGGARHVATSAEPSMRLAHDRLFAVTVTYGARRHYLCNALKSLADNGVRNVIVVDNGAAWNTAEFVQRDSMQNVEVLRLGGNTGSAVGFGRGIARALERGAQGVLLLDDDNQVENGAVAILIDAFNAEIVAGADPALLALLGFRPDHPPAFATGGLGRHARGRRNSFRGFHVFDIPSKIFRRIPRFRRRNCTVAPEHVYLQEAPYGGLMFHRDLIGRIGLPDPRFVLYADDNEFTHRIVRQGGRIALIGDARLLDQERSWNVKSRYANGFSAALCGGSDMRAYYSMRNGAYYDVFGRGHAGPVFWMNLFAYISVLAVFATWHWRFARLGILLTAVTSGLRGQLGSSEKYPL